MPLKKLNPVYYQYQEPIFTRTFFV